MPYELEEEVEMLRCTQHDTCVVVILSEVKHLLCSFPNSFGQESRFFVAEFILSKPKDSSE